MDAERGTINETRWLDRKTEEEVREENLKRSGGWPFSLSLRLEKLQRGCEHLKRM